MNSRDYWAQREAEALKHYITDEREYDRQIQQIYKDMLDACQKDIEAFYGKYAGAEGITIAEAKKRVSAADIAAYERKAARYVRERDFSKQANEEMRLYNTTMRINRMEMLKANIGLELIAGHDELEKFMGGILKGRTMEEMTRQAGILGKTVRNNATKANAIVNGSFHNGTFSDRIWQYQDVMRQDLGKLLQQGLIQGKNARAITKDLRKYLIGDKKGKGATYNVERLMRTELARVQTEAQKQSFIRNGFDMYTFLCNHNGNTCDICSSLNGLHFKVDKMMPGENAPPMHPHCRCSVAAYEDSDEYEAWLDYLSKGGTTEEWNKQKSGKIKAGGVENSEKDAIMKTGWNPGNVFDRKAREYDVQADLAAVNPNFATGEWKWTNNCQRCVPTYEMRRRGFRVTAKPIPSKNDTLRANYAAAWENQDRVWCMSGSGKTQILNQMAAWGDGARAEVCVAWSATEGHVFVAEQINGSTIFYDPQDPSSDASQYFRRCKKGLTNILRIDNNTPSKYITDCCQNGGD